MVLPDDLSARMDELSDTQRALLEELLVKAGHAVPDDEHAPPKTAEEQTLVDIWRAVLRTETVGVHDSFFALGGDSISSLQVSARAGAAGLRITSRQVLEEETIARLAAVATPMRGEDGASDDVPVGDVPLTPVQQWFFEQDIPDSHHWDQAILVDLHRPVDDEMLRRALAALVDHHDALRATFRRRDGSWLQEVRPTGPAPNCRTVDLRNFDEATRHKRMAAAMRGTQGVIDLERGPLVSVLLFRLGPDHPDRLLLAIHHLVVDGVSMRILMEDLETAHGCLLAGEEVRLPARTASFRRWGHALIRHAGSRALRDEIDYWRAVPDESAIPAWLGDHPMHEGASNTVGDSATEVVEVPSATVQALRNDLVRIPNLNLRNVLLAALLLAWNARTGRSALQLDLEGHGREQVGDQLDVSRTVGWFTSIHPVVLTLPGPDDLTAAVGAVRSRLAAVPDKGIGYGLLRYLGGAEGASLADLPASQVSFNYLGWFDRSTDPGSVFGTPVQVPAVLQSEAAPRRFLLDVVLTGVDERLVVELTYGRRTHRATDVRELAKAFVDFVVRLTDHYVPAGSRTAEGRAYPSMRVSEREISSIAKRVGANRQMRGDA